MAKDEWNWWEEDEPDGGATIGSPVTTDSNGTPLANGDSVILIKDLKVKGAGQILKRGTVVKNVRLTDNPDEIDCRTDAIKGLVLRTEFVKKR
ncbi:alkylphosphonate utilization protein [Sphingosinicella rhizophila]|uniref:Alkylphosphonate utilization protein n=1 Tax=Sphingosinicella rhizophila TaxID=3050082 RepID=A0ABU3Q888_9SPHN|nr:alkylphosphonate utilization protein [Sphingosinicella sp. GR2756]MDT9599628.1 alkylphosphonate utilization protein [Sphingosinicella sp. GR2756]